MYHRPDLWRFIIPPFHRRNVASACNLCCCYCLIVVYIIRYSNSSSTSSWFGRGFLTDWNPIWTVPLVSVVCTICHTFKSSEFSWEMSIFKRQMNCLGHGLVKLTSILITYVTDGLRIRETNNSDLITLHWTNHGTPKLFKYNVLIKYIIVTTHDKQALTAPPNYLGSGPYYYYPFKVNLKKFSRAKE